MKEKIRIYSLKDYVDEGKAETGSFIVKELIPEGKLGLLVGPSKTNKTTLAYMIGKAIADKTITHCLGHEVLVHAPILYIALEGGLGPQIRSFGTCDFFGLVDEKNFSLDEAKNLNFLDETIKSNNVKLVIIDCLYKAFSGNYSKAEEIRNTLVKLEELTRKHKSTILLLHHTGRENGKYEQNMNDVAGSFDIVRSSEFTLFLSSEQKTEEEEAYEASLSSEEYRKLPRKRILRKEHYRDGGEGYNKYSVDIYFNDDGHGYIETYKYKSKKKKAGSEDRIADLINCSVEILKKINHFKQGELAALLAHEYPALTENSITKNYMPQVMIELLKRNIIEKGKKAYLYNSNISELPVQEKF